MDFLDISSPPAQVLVIVAHPDDIDFGTAGTVARLINAGSKVAYALVTSGEAGAPEDLPRDEVAALRQAEQTAAAAIVGVTELHWLGWPDGRVEANLELRRDISRVIRQVKPDLVITQNPDANWDRIYGSHPDHLAAGLATMASVYPDARNPHAHPELLNEGHEPHIVPEVWITSHEPLDTFIDITDVFDDKVAALNSHTSQVAQIDTAGILRDWSESVQKKYDLPYGRIVEGFHRVTIG